MKSVLFVCGLPILRAVLENEGAEVLASGIVQSARQLGEIIPEDIFESGRDHTPARFRKWEHVIFIDCMPPLDFPSGTPHTVLKEWNYKVLLPS
jgi:hypothetical protein